MIVGKTDKEKKAEMIAGVRQYAWRPVKMSDGRIVWLDYYWMMMEQTENGVCLYNGQRLVFMPTLEEVREKAIHIRPPLPKFRLL
jgi:hypothetical protein